MLRCACWCHVSLRHPFPVCHLLWGRHPRKFTPLSLCGCVVYPQQARVGQATTQSSGQTPRVDDPLHYSFLDPSLIRRMTQTQPIPSGTQQPSHVAEAGAAVDNKDASAPECRHTPADDGSSPQSTDSRRQTVRSRRRTFEENEAAPLTASRRSAAKRPRTGDTQASDLPDLNLAGADASCGTSGTDAPISSRTRKRN